VERAVDKRRREFAAGRVLARDLFARIGLDPSQRAVPLLNDADRVPVWPAGVVGSITHCSSLCAVAIASARHSAGIGLDVEPAEPLKTELEPQILRAGDAACLHGLPQHARHLGGVLTFSIKEAVYKAIYPTYRRFLDFHEVGLTQIALESASSADLRGSFEVLVHTPDAAPPGRPRIAGRFRIASGHIAAAVVLPPLPGA
jgi:4'-phosphopantetheinyl transferase EntD